MKDRETAAKILYKAGWTTQEIAYVMRWKNEHAKQVLNRPVYVSETPSADAMGLELSLRAGKAVERLGVKTAAELRANLYRLHDMRGVGATTISQIQIELYRLPTILLIGA